LFPSLCPLCALWLILLNGCAARGVSERKGYFGPTEPIDRVIARINANNQRIPTLGAEGSFEAWFYEGNQERFLNGTAVVLYSAPMSLWLVASKDIAGRVFEIGSNSEYYWLTDYKDKDAMWWGRHANAARVDPETIPIQPDKILEVLAVQTLPADLLAEPTPTQRFNNSADAYMLLWNERLADRVVVRKEIWYDRATLLPTMVLLFDDDGRIVLRAYLSDHKPLKIDGDPSPPIVATKYDLFFPPNRSRMILDLSQVGLKRNGAPTEQSFRFPGEQGERAGVSNVIPLDRPTTQPR
jgi:hypothetical protein